MVRVKLRLRLCSLLSHEIIKNYHDLHACETRTKEEEKEEDKDSFFFWLHKERP